MKLSISLPDGIVSAIDEARGDVPRSLWIRRRLELEDRFDPGKHIALMRDDTGRVTLWRDKDEKPPLPVVERSPAPAPEVAVSSPQKPAERPVRVKRVPVRPIVQKRA